ncbi:hypothetical protein V6N12_034901 [Hibiscus sabdariffa]|uniref:Uncharacterized protein n=1 Tax=Hibiscus sabdariffa TaxID=183260 RepID=A0ABR2BNS9_9ROSI
MSLGDHPSTPSSETRVNGTLLQFQGQVLAETMSQNIRSCDTSLYAEGEGGSTNPTQDTKGAVEKAEEIMANTPKLVNPNVSFWCIKPRTR